MKVVSSPGGDYHPQPGAQNRNHSDYRNPTAKRREDEEMGAGGDIIAECRQNRRYHTEDGDDASQQDRLHGVEAHIAIISFVEVDEQSGDEEQQIAGSGSGIRLEAQGSRTPRFSCLPRHMRWQLLRGRLRTWYGMTCAVPWHSSLPGWWWGCQILIGGRSRVYYGAPLRLRR